MCTNNIQLYAFFCYIPNKWGHLIYSEYKETKALCNLIYSEYNKQRHMLLVHTGIAWKCSNKVSYKTVLLTFIYILFIAILLLGLYQRVKISKFS